MKPKSPFPYFGGKSTISDVVWGRFGNVKTYIEPFFGSGAVLFARPGDCFSHEIVNDYDGNIANVWRSIQSDPHEVARLCDWPCNHIDLMARRAVLIAEKENLRQSLIDDPEYCNPKLAGYWIWCICNWIGDCMLTESKSKSKECKRPELGKNKGIMGCDVQALLIAMQCRLRNVKVVCGDWSRVMGGNWQTNYGICGVFLDPPYTTTERSDCYDTNSHTVARDVREWCLQNGDNQLFRIALCGYDGEHNELEDSGWSAYKWKPNGGMANQGSLDSRGKKNISKETIWFSRNCLQDDLFSFCQE
ncbi:MAG: DNA adenine methylase [Bacilli bacterium]